MRELILGGPKSGKPRNAEAGAPRWLAMTGAVDAPGLLHQRVAAAYGRMTLMVAGCELAVKRTR